MDKEREFFCSELVAKAFKVLDVVKNPEIKSSSCYVPGHFDFDNIVDKDLKDDVALGPCLNILSNASMDLNKYENLHDVRQKSPRNSKLDKGYENPQIRNLLL